jgi:3-hydroxymyristoyl/3-hydroxydecanoyl-(acyl carrier protein) dehydratase
MTHEEVKRNSFLFALADRVEFLRIVRPEDKVTVLGETIAFRMRGLKSRVSMMLEDGSVVCSGIITGKGVDSPA